MVVEYASVTMASFALVSIVTLVVILSHFRRRFPKDIQGPPSPSFLFGHEKDIHYQNEVGDLDFQWMRQYGTAWRVGGCLGEDVLMLADPKGLQHILQGSAYNYPKSGEDRQFLRLITGDGLAWVHGETHRRQRKIMNPAFTAPQLRAFLPLFHKRAAKMIQRLKDEVTNTAGGGGGGGGAPVIDLLGWLTRMTLDVIGEAGFGYEFGTLDDKEDDFSKNWTGVVVESSLYPSSLDLIAKSFFSYIPVNILYYTRYLPLREYRRTRDWLDYTRSMARDIIRKSEAQGDGKDVMSVLIRANASENPKTRLSRPEVLDQISTLILAGTDTTALTASWVLWELAKDPAFQDQVREEIKAARAQVTARGDADFTIADLDSLTLLQAALKEGMRLHPIGWHFSRLAGKDDVIPLLHPITTKSGEQISSIPVRKGTKVKMSFCAYNRLPIVWGEDADRWNPMRWVNIDTSKQTTVGVYANLLNFSAGVRGCIGWKFSVIELQSILMNLLESFELTMPPDSDNNPILRKPAQGMAPIIEGHSGPALGLKIKILA
ncbi:hypothetical protein HETIRDRAFT_461179 [Heterobasidion irregulare TC 32-1]|uniref:Cytochrome P450 n=1 Tax=Heterobasidion irregulare (strain TC 32-1) TaxID=747525 RepID=W4JRV5_HETIT|nr:uncharacterized protein HETIRDRAFT_461179 [Heterobasidion irregulare TC 32-1]ETW76268.1 hypothetical protein HETIRDRAFT_461179 [Heterobasidion irregulare TC 32-1]